MHLRLAGVLLLALLIGSDVQAEVVGKDWSVHVWRRSDGLPSNIITGVAQSQDGYLWVATDKGMARFDGARFVEFSTSTICDSTNECVPALARGHGGGIILANDAGRTARLMIGSPPQIRSSGLAAVHPICLQEDKEGSIWVSYHPGTIMRLEPGKSVDLTAAVGIPSEKQDCYVAEAIGGRLWFCRGTGVGIFDKQGFTTLVRVPAENTRIAAAREGGIWAYSGGQLFRCRESQAIEQRASLGPKRAALEVYSLLEDH